MRHFPSFHQHFPTPNRPSFGGFWHDPGALRPAARVRLLKESRLERLIKNTPLGGDGGGGVAVFGASGSLIVSTFATSISGFSSVVSNRA